EEDKEEQDTKSEEKQKNEKAHRKSRKKRKKEKEKKKSKRRRRDKHKHNSPSSDDSSDFSIDSDVEHTERSHKKGGSLYRDYDSSFLQHGHLPGNYKAQHNKKSKTKEYDDYGNYSDDSFGNYNEEEKEEDFADHTDLGAPFSKELVKKQGMKGIQKVPIQAEGGRTNQPPHHPKQLRWTRLRRRYEDGEEFLPRRPHSLHIGPQMGPMEKTIGDRPSPTPASL
uniref:Uncharacterized protein n=1 Tax=Sphenodon punctatus TaxID=8508 RepID=A0A8D0HG05_SPHPU